MSVEVILVEKKHDDDDAKNHHVKDEWLLKVQAIFTRTHKQKYICIDKQTKVKKKKIHINKKRIYQMKFNSVNNQIQLHIYIRAINLTTNCKNKIQKIHESFIYNT